MLRQVTYDKWPDDIALITAYDTDTKEYTIFYETSQFETTTAEHLRPAQTHQAFAALSAAKSDPNPILNYENRHNIYIPTNSKDLLGMPNGPLKSLFITATHTEVHGMKEQNLFKLVLKRNIPKWIKLLKSRAVYTMKYDQMTGVLDKAKCRIVACGYSQVYGIDFTETYASTPKLSTARYFIHMVVQFCLIMSSAASARFELGVNSDTREFEVSEKEGESLEISNADAFEIIECFWRKLLVVVMLSTQHVLAADAPYSGLSLSTLQDGTVVMLTMNAAVDLSEALKKAAKGGMPAAQVAELIDDVECELTRLTAGNNPSTYAFAVSVQVTTVQQDATARGPGDKAVVSPRRIVPKNDAMLWREQPDA